MRQEQTKSTPSASKQRKQLSKRMPASNCIANTSKFTQQCNVVPCFYAVYLAAATSQFSVLIRQKMQLTGWDNGN
jgi:hypothetical protein